MSRFLNREEVSQLVREKKLSLRELHQPAPPPEPEDPEEQHPFHEQVQALRQVAEAIGMAADQTTKQQAKALDLVAKLFTQQHAILLSLQTLLDRKDQLPAKKTLVVDVARDSSGRASTLTVKEE